MSVLRFVTLTFSIAIGVALTCVAPQVARAQGKVPGRKLAFLVGVGEYHHGKLNDLEFTENDVEDLEATLRAQSYKTLLLTTRLGKKAPDKQPTRQNIWNVLHAFLKEAKPTKSDLMIVCLAGHGIQPLGSDESYFCPSDANPTIKELETPKGSKNVAAFPETLVAVGDVLKELDDAGVGYKLLLVDACRNDPSVRGRRGLDHVNVAALPDQTGVLLSCRSGEFSFEHKSLGRGHGAFFHHVIMGLGGAARDAKGRVTWDGLGLYIRSEVPSKVREIFGDQGGTQNPNAINNISGEPAVLARIIEPVTPAPVAMVRTVPSPTPTSPTPSPTPHGDSPAVTAPTGAKDAAPALLTVPFTREELKAARVAWAHFYRKSEETTNSIGMPLVLIPAGRFSMGSAETADDLLKDFPYAKKEWLGGERPVHSVTIRQPYFLGKHEVTKGQFQKFVDETNYLTDAEKEAGKNAGATWRDSGFDQTDDSPVVNVSFKDALAFCDWLSRREGKDYRLPSEAEWEYACRAGTTTRFPNGDRAIDLTKIGNVADSTGRARFPEWEAVDSSDGYVFTSPVGKFPPNPFGLHDMIGNVGEWCFDRYDGDYYTSSPLLDPKGPTSGVDRVYRGGGFNTDPVLCRSAARDSDAPTYRNRNLGFRIVCRASEAVP